MFEPTHNYMNALVSLGIVPPSVVNAASDKDFSEPDDVGDGEVLIYGPIVDEGNRVMLDELFGVASTSPLSFRDAVNAIEGDVLVRVNSPGGFVSQGAAIQQTILENRKRRKMKGMIDGSAYSAAAWLALSLDDLEVSQFGDLMIHRAWSYRVGNADEMLATSEKLAKFDVELESFIEERLDYKALGFDTPMDLMKGTDGQGTFISASEAVRAGIATVYDFDDGADQVQIEPGWNETDQFTMNALSTMLRARNNRRLQHA